MGGPGSGGHNRKSLDELRIAGTMLRARHLLQPPPKDDPKKAAAAWKRFQTALKKAKAPAVDPLTAYARSVVAGEVLAGRYHRLSCARHLRDVARQGTPDFPYRLDLARVTRLLVFVRQLKHYKGSWAGQRIQLQPYQVFRLGSIVGWVHVTTGLRRYRRSYHEIPRKNGKSLEAAIMALYLTFFDGEGGAEGYCVATKKDQARIVWNDAAQLVRSSILKVGIQAFAHSIFDMGTMSKLVPLGADADSMDGLNPHVVINDEFHAQKDRGVIDVMQTAMGARDQPHDMRITTAGDDPVSPCGDEHLYAERVLEQVLRDETYFAFIAHADPEDLEGGAWQSEATARKANPNYGVSVKPDDLRALAAKAGHMPGEAAQFQQKRLNVWVNTAAPWLSLDGWRKGQTRWTVDDMRGQACWCGVDLSSKVDLTAVVFAFPPAADRKAWRLVVHALTPAETLDDRAHRDRAPYGLWVQSGHLQTCPGARIDQDAVRDIVTAGAAAYDLQGVGIDPWNAGNLIAELGGLGLDVVEIPQTIRLMSQPSKEFEADVLEGLIDAGGHPLMAWCISNVVVQRDGKDNIYPTKKSSRGRIDPVIAALLARKLAVQPVAAPVKNYGVYVFDA